MKKTELKFFVESVLNETLTPCQEKLLEYLTGNDRSIGFIRMTDSLITTIGYNILWDIVEHDIKRMYVNLGDPDLNSRLFEYITNIINNCELYDDLNISEINILDDLLIIDDIMITTDEQSLTRIEKYYIFDMFNDDNVLEIVDNIIEDKQQSFVLMDTITKYIILENKYNNILDAFIYTITYSDYHNCNSEVLQSNHKSK